MSVFHSTDLGSIHHADSLELMESLDDDSVDLVMTSPPFALLLKKEYGNESADQYSDWFKPFASEIHRILKPSGSFVFELGGSWNKGMPTRSLYHFRLALMLCDEMGFHLAHEYFWWNPSRLPSPAEWVTVRKVRAKDAVSVVWWLSKTPWPKAGNQRVLQPYSDSMRKRLVDGEQPKHRPSGHYVSANFNRDNGGAIPPNLLAIPNTESNSAYIRYCRDNDIKPHPARYPAALPEYFIRFLTDPDDLVLDPFAGSCTTGIAAERLSRKWLCADLDENYLQGAVGRFEEDHLSAATTASDSSYSLTHPAASWGEHTDQIPIAQDGGRTRPPKITADTPDPRSQITEPDCSQDSQQMTLL